MDNFNFSFFIFLLLALIAEVIGTIAGFGSSVFFVPLAQFFLNFQSVLIITALFHDFSNFSKIILFGKQTDRKLLLLFGVPSTLLVILGAYFSQYLKSAYPQLILGIFLLVFSSILFIYEKAAMQKDRFTSITAGSVAGFLAGFIGTGGAIRGLSLTAFNLEKNVFIATSAGIDFFVDASRTVVYISNGYFKKEHLFYIPGLVIIAFFGSYIGKRVLNRIRQDHFKKIVLILLMGIGISMIVRFFYQ